MTHIARISALVAILYEVLSAATVPQDSADKYFFTRPVATNAIRGVVMGDPPAYKNLRREDIAWLYEAIAEREALWHKDWNGAEDAGLRLVPQYGSWPLAESNRFYRYVTAATWTNGVFTTNIVVGYNQVASPHGIDTARIDWQAHYRLFNAYRLLKETLPSNYYYLEPDDSRYVDFGMLPSSGWHEMTNIVVTVETNYNSELIRTNETFITITMTNGTVSVHTNRWTELLPQVVTKTKTNLWNHSYLGLMFTNELGYVENMTNAPPKEPIRYDFYTPFLYSDIRACYDWLKGMKRLAITVWPTNLIVKRRDFYNGTTSGFYYSTNTFTSGSIEYSMSAYINDTRSGYFSSGTWVPTSTTTKSGGHNHHDPDRMTLHFPTDFTWAVLHTGGVSRVASARLHIGMFLHYGKTASSSWYTSADNSSRESQSFTTNVSVYATIRMNPAVEIGTNSDGKVVFSADVLFDPMARLAWYFAGEKIPMPSLPQWQYQTSQHFTVHDAKHGTETGVFPSYAQTNENWDIYFREFILLVDLAPWTSLPDW